MRYIAFQLGINLGKRQVKMQKLKQILEQEGFQNVRTLLASGNVVFETIETDADTITKKLDTILSDTFGFTIKNIVRSEREIQKLVISEPFKGISITPKIRLFVTFLTKNSTKHITIPQEAKQAFMKFTVTNREVSYVLSETKKTTDVMSILVKMYGRDITTRNWNTILKIHKLLSE